MGFIQAVGKAFGLTHRLFVAVAVVVGFTALLSALATLWLPFEVIGTPPVIRVPAPQNWEEVRGILLPALTLFLCSSFGFLFLLAATLGSLRKLLHGEPFSPLGYFQSGGRWFFPILGWMSVLGLLFLALSSLLGIPLAIQVGGLGSEVELKKGMAVFGLVLMMVHLAGFLIFLFSPVSLVERSRGVWDSLGDSLRFLFRHLLGTVGLFASAVVVGVLLTVVGIVLGGVVNSIRGMLGIPPFVKGWPVFFFTLILGLPQAYLTVYFPALLYSYYHSNSSQASTT